MGTIAEIIGGAIRLVWERPGSILIWGLAYIVGWILFGIGLAVAMVGLGLGDGLGSAPAEAIGMTWFWLVGAAYLFLFFLTALMMCTVYRAILRPHETSFFSMRLGLDELRLTGLFLLLMVASIALWIVIILLLNFMQSAILLVSVGNVTVAAWLSAAVTLLVTASWIYFAVRLSLIFPATFHYRRLTVDAGWELSDGRFWTLLLSYALMAVVITLVLFAAAYPLFGQYYIDMIKAGDDPLAQQLALNSIANRTASMPRGLLVLDGLLVWIGGMIAYVLGYGVQASAARVFLIKDGVLTDADDEAKAGPY